MFYFYSFKIIFHENKTLHKKLRDMTDTKFNSMDQELTFERPNDSHRNSWYDILKEFESNNEEVTPWSLNFGIKEFDNYLKISESEHTNINFFPGYVKASTFFLIRKTDKKILGAINIRHELNEFLFKFGGHIGYGIRPTERKKGYGTMMLKFGLKFSKELNLNKVLVSCFKNNIGSKKIIEKNGGKNPIEFLDFNNKIILKY